MADENYGHGEKAAGKPAGNDPYVNMKFNPGADESESNQIRFTPPDGIVPSAIRLASKRYNPKLPFNMNP